MLDSRKTNTEATLVKEVEGKYPGGNGVSLPFPDRRIVDRRMGDRRIGDRRKINAHKLKKITVVIPALNEEHGIGQVVDEIPISELRGMGYSVEIMVIDNGSTDETKLIANNRGAKVIVQPIKGYGNAYKAGFANASGNIICTGDADLTYPFTDLDKIIKKMEDESLDFITTDRLSGLRSGVMTRTHYYGNRVFSFVTKILYNLPFKDSQSGMWIFKREIWPYLDMKSSGMPFSQELKIEAYKKGFKCAEVPIDYRARIGEVKLNTFKDGIGNMLQLIGKRFSLKKRKK